jgi:hypothetical protein
MLHVLGETQDVPLYFPIVFAGWGVVWWCMGLRRMVRDPHVELRRSADVRARSRLLHPFDGGDVEREFRQLWRMRWLWWPAAIGYAVGVLGLFVTAIRS